MNNKQIFIPLSIDMMSYTKENYFLSGKKVAQMVVFLFGELIFFAMSTKAVNGSTFGTLFTFTILVIGFIYFLRIIIFEERRWKRLFKELEKNKYSSYEYFWNIETIEEDGLIRYEYDGANKVSNGVVLKVIKGSVIGRSSSYINDFSNQLSEIMREFNSRGYEFRIYYVQERNEIPNNVKRMIARATRIQDPLFRRVALEHANYHAKRVKANMFLEAIYFLVKDANPNTMDKLKPNVLNIANRYLSKSIFKPSEILEKERVRKFMAYILQISAFNDAIGEDDIPDFDLYATVEYAIDSDGNEITIDFPVEEESKSRFKLLPISLGKKKQTLFTQKDGEEQFEDESIDDLYDEEPDNLSDDDLDLEAELNETNNTEEEVVKPKTDYTEIIDFDEIPQIKDDFDESIDDIYEGETKESESNDESIQRLKNILGSRNSGV